VLCKNSGNHERKCHGKIIRGRCDECCQKLMWVGHCLCQLVFFRHCTKHKTRNHLLEHSLSCLARNHDERRFCEMMLGFKPVERASARWTAIKWTAPPLIFGLVFYIIFSRSAWTRYLLSFSS
jgi:hypothetical protein